jgi:aconitate hydratase
LKYSPLKKVHNIFYQHIKYNNMFDFELVKTHFDQYAAKIETARKVINRPLTLSEKILYSHSSEIIQNEYKRGTDYAFFNPDRVAMQDATAQMALLQLMNSGRKQTAVPATVHCDHLILAENGTNQDLNNALQKNEEVFTFLKTVSNKFGIGFWKPGSGIIHQIVLENYAFPGGMMIGTDSHTVNAGGLGMIAIGVGGADAVDVMAGMPWELKMPKLIGVKLTGKLNGWASAKDIILKVAGILTAKGGTNAIIEYFGDGADSLSCTGKATICNMGAEVGATTSIFGYDKNMSEYLRNTFRNEVADMADAHILNLNSDKEVMENPNDYYDQFIEIDLSTLEPFINGPMTPDKATPISEFKTFIKDNNYPAELKSGLIGSCTNSSYEDLNRSASIVKFASDNKIVLKSEFIITPGSDMIKSTTERDGILQKFENAGAVIMANACGPCIGQWNRKNEKPEDKNSIITSFNRNFAKRNDGNPNTFSFVASPEIVTALSIAGSMDFNPITDTLTNSEGIEVKLPEPSGSAFPQNGFITDMSGYIAPGNDKTEVIIKENSDRLQKLESFEKWDGNEYDNLALLIKAEGKCTTDHISMAGPWLKYRGHLENISDNLLMGAVNSFNGSTNAVLNSLTQQEMKVSESAKEYKKANIGSIVIAEENYGEGSSREHAAMEPRFLGVKAIIVKSFARIHETNLKKQGMLALTFQNKDDYDKIKQDDKFSLCGLKQFSPTSDFSLTIKHSDGTEETIKLNHTYNKQQIEWFKAGSALNLISQQQ